MTIPAAARMLAPFIGPDGIILADELSKAAARSLAEAVRKDDERKRHRSARGASRQTDGGY